jgi:hypothetical protein
MLFLTTITVAITSYRSMYLPHKNNWKYSTLISLIATLLVFVVFAFITLTKFLTVWTDAATIYVKKTNPQIKIVSRYLNEGAFGGGTEPGDYEIVLERSITPYLKMETLIDTNLINKKEWIKQ